MSDALAKILPQHDVYPDSHRWNALSAHLLASLAAVGAVVREPAVLIVSVALVLTGFSVLTLWRTCNESRDAPGGSDADREHLNFRPRLHFPGTSRFDS